jgi:hypothetical protein
MLENKGESKEIEGNGQETCTQLQLDSSIAEGR